MLRNITILIVTILIGAALTYALDHHNALSPSPSISEQIAQDAFVNGEVVPSFVFVDSAGNERSIEDFRGKIVVLNFWASWCAPCVIEMPLFMDLAEEFPDRVVFIGLSSDFTTKAMDRFLEKLESDKPKAVGQNNVIFAFDTDAAITRDMFQTFRLPETIIIDQQGIMREKLIGADWKYEDLKSIVNNF